MSIWKSLTTAATCLLASTTLTAAPLAQKHITKTNNLDSSKRIVQLGIDNAGNPVYMGYKAKGMNDGRPVLVLIDPYLGMDSWKHVQERLSKDYYTIAMDNLGYGMSSKNLATDLDGINGNQGYSYRQQAYFTHKAMDSLNPQGPITFVGVDTQGNVGMWYATDYANSTHPATKLLLEDTSIEPIVSDDPCSLAYLNTATMQSIVNFYAVNPAGAVAAVLGGTFKTTNCPAVQQQITDLAVAYAITAPLDAFSRIVLNSYKEDTTPLMEGITIPVLTTYGTNGDISPVSRRAIGITLVGNSPGYPNAAIPGTCTTLKPFVNGFKNARFITYPGHGTVVHLTSFDNYVHDLENFVTGKDQACSVYLP